MNALLLMSAMVVFAALGKVHAQTAGDFKSKDTVKGAIYNSYDKTYVDYEALGACKIVKKDFKTIKNIKIVSVFATYFTYEKDGSLHDMLIENVTRIETNYSYLIQGYYQNTRKYFSVYFDKGGHPFMKVDNEL